MKFSFIIIVLILIIVIAFIIINSNAFGKTKKFVTSCVSSSPAFQYKCADTLIDGGTDCPFGQGWSVDRSKECSEGVQCCYKER